MAPWNVVHGRSFQVHAEKVAKHEAREAIWDDKMTATAATTKFSPPRRKPSSEAAAGVNAPLMKESGARGPGSASPLYDDHVVAPLHLNGTQAREEGAEENHIATGYTVDALIDALLQIGDSEEYGSVASLGTSSFYSEDAGSENAAIDDKSMVCGGVGEEKTEAKTKTMNSSAGVAGEEVDAWEDMKRRVMQIEEFGALPLDGVGAGAGAGDAERASREFRARRRRSWAEKTIRGHAREEGSRRAATKKRRRHAGCWVREDGVFMRLVSDILIILPLPILPLFCIHRLTRFFTRFRSTHVECEAYQAFGL
jgi:hypothetical protein